MSIERQLEQLDGVLRPSFARRVAPYIALAQDEFVGDPCHRVATALTEAGREYTDAYVNALVQDYDALIADALEAVRTGVKEVEDVVATAVVDRNDYSLNPRVSGRIRPRITMPIGFILALEETVLAAAAEPEFFGGSLVAATEPVHAYHWPRDPTNARFSYQHALSGDTLNLSSLGTALPTDLWRLMQAQYLIDAAIAFVVMHEFSHWSLGHLGLGKELGLSDEFAWSELAMAETITPLSEAHEKIRQCVELEADATGIDLLVSFQRNPDEPHSLASRFNAAFAALEATPPHALRNLSEQKALRLLLLGASTAMLVIEGMRRHNLHAGNGIDEPIGYPSPAARCYSLLRDFMVHGLFKYAEVDADGVVVFYDIPGQDITALFKAELKEPLAMTLFDLAFLAREIDVPHLFLETADIRLASRPDSYLASPILVDLVTEIAGAGSVETFQTQAARQNHMLKKLSAHVREKCNAYRRFG